MNTRANNSIERVKTHKVESELGGFFLSLRCDLTDVLEKRL